MGAASGVERGHLPKGPLLPLPRCLLFRCPSPCRSSITRIPIPAKALRRSLGPRSLHTSSWPLPNPPRVCLYIECVWSVWVQTWPKCVLGICRNEREHSGGRWNECLPNTGLGPWSWVSQCGQSPCFERESSGRSSQLLENHILFAGLVCHETGDENYQQQ